MSIHRIGPCRICERTSSRLDFKSEICPACASDPESARERHSKFLVKVWFIYRPIALVVFLGIAYVLTKLLDFLKGVGQ